MDAIFKALSDDTRRKLLDMLKRRDGQTLTELESKLGMTRFGVMKHLKILEEATLVVTRKSGRFKYHYLNAVQLQMILDRWIDPLVQKPLSPMSLDLKMQLDGKHDMSKQEESPDFILETFIKTSPEALWEALIKPEIVAKYHFSGAMPDKVKKEGARVNYILPNGSPMLSFEVLQEVPGKRLEMTFEPHFFGPGAPHSRCIYEIAQEGGVCRLTISHFNIPKGQEGVKEGWARITSSIKSFLETGAGITGEMDN